MKSPQEGEGAYVISWMACIIFDFSGSGAGLGQTMQIKLAAQRRQQVLHFLHGELFFCQPKQDVFFYRQAWEKQRFLGNEINTQLMSMNWR